MKQAAVIATVMFLSITAYAGKADREYMKNTVTPAVKKATDAVKKSCGCAMTITVNESTIKTENDMSPARYIAESVADGVAGYCTDDASKKAVCQMKTLEITKAAEAVFTFKGSKGVASTDGQSHVSFEMMTRELDK